MNTVGERISGWQGGLQPSLLLRAGSQLGYCQACPQSWATESVALPWQGPPWRVQQEWGAHGAGDSMILAWQGGTLAQKPTEKQCPAAFPCCCCQVFLWGSPGTVMHRGPTQVKRSRASPVVPPAHSPLCTDQRESNTLFLRSGKPTPHPAWAQSDCPFWAMPWLLLQTALQVSITHPKRGILLDSCGRIMYHRKAR